MFTETPKRNLGDLLSVVETRMISRLVVLLILAADVALSERLAMGAGYDVDTDGKAMRSPSSVGLSYTITIDRNRYCSTQPIIITVRIKNARKSKTLEGVLELIDANGRFISEEPTQLNNSIAPSQSIATGEEVVDTIDVRKTFPTLIPGTYIARYVSWLLFEKPYRGKGSRFIYGGAATLDILAESSCTGGI